MREWQKFSCECETVPPSLTLLQFLDLEAIGESERRCPVVPQVKKVISRLAYNVTIDDVCVECKTAKHPLYTCKTFHASSHNNKMGIVKENNLCMNYLGSRHYLKECCSSHRCKKCHNPHHSWLHTESKGKDCKTNRRDSESGKSTDVVTANTSQTVEH